MEGERMNMQIEAIPYNWPFDNIIDPGKMALMIIDMQIDFCGKGGYVEQMGYDLSLTAQAIAPIKKLLDRVRQIEGFTVIHTREGHKPDLSDLPPNKKWRSKQVGAEIGSLGPAGRILVRGELGWGIIDELTPREGEPIIDKPGKGSFYATDLDLILKNKGITHLILTGITTDVCVHTTMREANDRGYECLILEDCTGATDKSNHLAALKMVTMQGGVFGSVSSSANVMKALEKF
jgi:nicotinamidase-related amidase